jgi:hypothetical protein
MGAPTRVSGVYAKPLIGENLNVNPEGVLRKLKAELNRRLKAKFQNIPTFSDRARKSLSKSLRIKIFPNSLVITTSHPGFKPLVFGQEKRQMKWLTKAKVPIPIVLDSGEMIFRWATPRSMENGSWWHPGRGRVDFITKAKQEAKKFIKERMTREVMLQLRQTLHNKKGR